MFELDLSFNEAVEYIYTETVLEKEAIEALLKGIFQIQMQQKKGVKLFNKGQVRDVIEETRRDKSLSYYGLKISKKTVKKLIQACNSEVPHIS